MNFYVLTIFPEMVNTGLNHSIIKRAMEKKIISVRAIDIREFSKNKHKKVDDYAYGGGAGMVMQAQPIYDAYMSIKEKVKPKTRVIYMTPQGEKFSQEKAKELSKEKEIIFLCGHYEGIDERVIEEIVTDEVSIGDFILTGGELPAMMVIDAVSRILPNVLGKEESFTNESFTSEYVLEGEEVKGRRREYNLRKLLEYPVYTRPIEFNGKKVPEVLISGNHKKIKEWKKEQAIKRTVLKRPDLLEGE